MHEFFEAKRSSFWRTTISANSGNSQKLWRTLNGVLVDAVTKETGSKTADEFATYFKDKVDSVRASTATTPLYDVPLMVTPTLSQWTAVTPDEVEKMFVWLGSKVTGHQHLHSATQRKLVLPHYRLNSFGRRRFFVVGPSTWNSLPDSLHDPELSLDTFKRQQLKTYIFAKY